MNSPVNPVNLEQVRRLLNYRYSQELFDLEFIGEGAWSQCFGFKLDDEDLVIRFGYYATDFHKDRQASAYSSFDLPIPRVVEIGQALDRFYAISDRYYGVPLESLDAVEWVAVVPSIVKMMEAIRLADISATNGFGEWDEFGKASAASWSEHLVRVARDELGMRTHGWRARLDSSEPEFAKTLDHGKSLLKTVAFIPVPRNLLHCDLINRNVLVNAGKVSAVFDWGCSRYGDHLYDLAWFEFWASWFPDLDINYLRQKLEEQWREIGYVPNDLQTRLMACYLHIGLDHIAYNAHLGNWTELNNVVERIQILVKEF